MSVFKWAYDPKICEGNPCPNDCEICSLKDLIDEKESYMKTDFIEHFWNDEWRGAFDV